MPVRQNKKKRRDRYERELEKQVQAALDPPSEGQFCVLDKKTKQKHRGLNWKQAQALWNSLESAIILQDEHVRNGTL
jgi:hypothetical protein